MNESVLRSMARWPNVPAVYGWLELDRRGYWRIKNERVHHPGFVDTIARNYARDSAGRWYFQNGPQRVFVRIHYLPYVIRVEGRGADLRFVTHTGDGLQRLEGAWLDEAGNIVVAFDGMAGSICDHDLAEILPLLTDEWGRAADPILIERALAGDQDRHPSGLFLQSGQRRLAVGWLHSSSLPARFSFIPTPSPALGEPDC